MKTSSIISMGLTKFQTMHKVQRKDKPRQSCNGTHLTLLFDR
jgi:hypothetical protein